MLYITKYGPTVGRSQFTAITTDNSKSCCDVNDDGTEHNFPYDNSWLVLTVEAQSLWRGDFKEENGFIWGLVKRKC